MRPSTLWSANRHRRRGGNIAIETLLFLPLFVLVLAAFVEFAAIQSAQQKLVRASHAGAKAASEGADLRQIREVVDVNLGPGALGRHREIKVAMVVHTPHGEHMVPVNHPERLPARTPVVVQICAPAAKVAPNLLRSVGFNLSDDELSGETVMWKE
ncbi:MAG TPA: TadE/TadG family type IV pilus assembly protein [Gemmataceae bacterium]|nr:TadE/TadG family type IV pilus assembly protein [Gemmataceae bacterium]